MILLHVVEIELIQRCLLKLPDIVKYQESQSYEFPQHVVNWLKELEQILETAHVPILSEVTALRSKLLVSLHGNNSDRGHITKKKYREEIASSVLQSAQKAVSNSIAWRLDQLREAQTIANQIAAVARAKGVLNGLGNDISHAQIIKYVLDKMSKDADTATAMVHMIGLAGYFDAIILLDRAFPELIP